MTSSIIKFKLSCYTTFFIILSLIGCDNLVEPEVFSELSPETTLRTEKGFLQILNNAYYFSSQAGWDTHTITNIEEMTTDVFWNEGGGESRYLPLMDRFTWDPSTENIDILWNKEYKTIRAANIALDNISIVDVSEKKRNILKHEAKFLRALSFYRLYNWYGPVPLRISGDQKLEIPRASEDEYLSFIESELLQCIEGLPELNETEYGRATSSAAKGLLALLYLNTDQWENCVKVCRDIITSDKFNLVDDYKSMFMETGERNAEFIWARYFKVPEVATSWISGSFPPGFKSDPKTGIEWLNSMRNWATQYKIYDEFYNSFDQNDIRRILIMDEYIDKKGNLISLRNQNNYRALKYYDMNAVAQYHGTDEPEIRYAEILLALAESLNEISGPNVESIQLINLIRSRAGLSDLMVGMFSDKDELRLHILKERGWEFYVERKRRRDLIRMNKFLEYAKLRGVENPEEFRIRFPIPQVAMDANPLLEQNPGY